MATIKELSSITAQHNEIIKRITNGSLDPVIVKRALQDVIEGKFHGSNWNPPIWWRTPEQQIARARELWPRTALPKPPVNFVPQTETEVLLLHVPGTFEALWRKVIVPEGNAGHYWNPINLDQQSLRLAPNKREFIEPVWLGFDPEHGKGKSPNSFWGNANLAASEVFSALIQFPGWSLSWLNDASSPNLSGYQLKYDGSWSDVPCVCQPTDHHQPRLHVDWAGFADFDWASPIVREC